MTKTPKKFVLALDQGTTSSRAILFTHDGRPAAIGAAGVSANPACAGHRRARSRGDLELAARRGPRSARQSRCYGRRHRRDRRHQSARNDHPVGARDRPPVANAIVWQSRVSAPICDRLKADGAGTADSRKDRPGRSTLISPAPKSNICSTRSPACARAPSAAKSCSAPSIRF